MRRRYRRRVLAAFAWLCCAVAVVHAADGTTTPANDVTTTTRATDRGETRLPELVVEATPVYSAASSDEINAKRFELRPHTRMIQLLNNIPGLVVAQHRGGNKAPQWLIRGFDADHGTDINVMVDELPVNLVSHAHGQGYADINFMIPELVNRIDYRKGPYYADEGDFASAGSAHFYYFDVLPQNFATVTLGVTTINARWLEPHRE